MNKKAMIAVAMAFNLASGSFAFAQGNSDHGDRRNDRREEVRHDSRDFGRGHNEYMRQGRGAGPGHAYYQGDRFPAEYRNRHYVVDDWRGHNLSAPRAATSGSSRAATTS